MLWSRIKEKECFFKNEDNPRDLWDDIKCTNYRGPRSRRRRARGRGLRKNLKTQRKSNKYYTRESP